MTVAQAAEEETTVKKILLLLALLSFGAGCFMHHDDVVGSGNRQTQKRNVPAFTSIATNGAFEIDIVSQKAHGLEIEADDNILPLITTEVSNNVLHIRSLRSHSVRQPVTLKITVPNLEGLAVNGVGQIEVSDLKNDKFEIDANGTATIRVSGETKLVDIDSNGAGKVDAHKLRAARAVVDAKGVARVEVYASEQLDATVSGPAHVVYEGNAVVNKTVHGPGTIEKKVSEGS
jgi:hypothetical protein